MLSTQFMTTNSGKSCFNCLNSSKDKGERATDVSPEIPGEAVCEADYDVDDNIDGIIESANNPAEALLPKICGHYNPVMVDQKCGNPDCKNHIHSAEFEHPFWFTMYDNIPCCSKECVDVLETRANAEEDARKNSDYSMEE